MEKCNYYRTKNQLVDIIIVTGSVSDYMTMRESPSFRNNGNWRRNPKCFDPTKDYHLKLKAQVEIFLFSVLIQVVTFLTNVDYWLDHPILYKVTPRKISGDHKLTLGVVIHSRVPFSYQRDSSLALPLDTVTALLLLRQLTAFYVIPIVISGVCRNASVKSSSSLAEIWGIFL